MQDVYVVAGRNLRAVVADWLEGMEDPDDSLLAEARQAQDPDDARFYGCAYVMSHIAPRVWGDKGTEDELLLFAAIATYQDHAPLGWTDCATFVEGAFGYLHHIGEVEAARRLRAAVDNRASEEYAQKRRERDAWLKRDRDPARVAEQDPVLAQGSLRELRAAAVLDPAGNVAPWER